MLPKSAVPGSHEVVLSKCLSRLQIPNQLICNSTMCIGCEISFES